MHSPEDNGIEAVDEEEDESQHSTIAKAFLHSNVPRLLQALVVPVRRTQQHACTCLVQSTMTSRQRGKVGQGGEGGGGGGGGWCGIGKEVGMVCGVGEGDYFNCKVFCIKKLIFSSYCFAFLL